MEYTIYISGLLACGIAALIYYLSSQKAIKIPETGIPLSKVLPIQNIEQDYIINGNGDITVGYKLMLPEVFTLSTTQYEKIFDDLNGILKMLPAGTVIHQQNFYYEGVYTNNEIGGTSNHIHRENLKYYQGKPIINNYTNLYITFTVNPSTNKGDTNSTLLRKPNYPFVQPYKDIEKDLPEIEALLLNFDNGIKSIEKLTAIRMNNNELNNAIYDYINGSFDTPTTDATQMAVSPISVSSNGDLLIGNKIIRVLSLIEEGNLLFPYDKEPKTPPASSFRNGITIPEHIKSKASMTYPIGLGLPINHILNITIEILDSDKTLEKLNSESKSLNFLAMCYEPASRKKKAIKKFSETVTNFGYTTACTGVNVILIDSDKNKLDRNTSLTQNAFMNMNHSKCFVENFDTANLFFATIPGNARSNFRGFTNTTIQGLCYLCKEGLYISDPKGFIYYDRFGRPVSVDFWFTKKVNNKNMLMIGPSGTGKSYWINGFILQSIIHNFDNIIIDIGGSYKNMIHLNGGRYFDSRNIKSFSFNPFLCPKDPAGRYIYQVDDPDDEEASNDTINKIATIIAKIWKKDEDIKSIEWELLKKSIKDFYEKININPEKTFPCLTSYRNFIETYQLDDYKKSKFDINGLSIMLQPYSEGEYKFLLNSTENIDITTDTLIGFDMEDAAKKEYFPIVTLIVLNLAIDKIKNRRGIKKRLIVDEGLDFLMDKKMGEFIASLYRTYRKKEGGIMVAAQNVKFIKNLSPLIQDSVVGNCDIKVILDHRQYADFYPEVQSILSLSDNEIEMLKSIQTSDTWRQFFVKIGSQASILGYGVSEYADAAFDSRESVVVQIEELFKKTGSLPAALHQYVENKKRIFTSK